MLTSVSREHNPKLLNVSTCYSVLPHACCVHWLGVLERHNTSVLLWRWYSILLGFTQLKTDHVQVKDPGLRMQHASSNKSSTISTLFTPELPTVTPSLTRLLLSAQFIYKTMNRSGGITNPCRGPTHKVNGCDPIPPTQTQTSQDEKNDMTVSNW